MILAGSKAEDRAAVSLSHDQGPCWRPSDLLVGGHEDGLITNTVRDRFPVPPAVGLLQIADYEQWATRRIWQRRGAQIIHSGARLGHPAIVELLLTMGHSYHAVTWQDAMRLADLGRYWA